MRKKLSYIFIFSSLLWSACTHNNEEKITFYDSVDEEISNVYAYDLEKEKRIEDIKNNLKKETSPEMRRTLTNLLISEYEAYKSDSALFYINLNLINPVVKNNPYYKSELLIKKGDIAAHAGLFQESKEILDGIDKNLLDKRLLESYYSAYCDLYQYQAEYSTDTEYAKRNEVLREKYIDSVSNIADHSSINYVINYSAKQAREGNYKDAENLLLENLKKYKSGDRNYSILASILAYVYKEDGKNDHYHKYIAESVISDIRGAVKENMAIRALATECFEAGDLERADKYLRQSFADANFFSARMRNAQSSRMLPVIGEAYVAHQKTLNHKLRLLVIFISILAFGFIVISIIALLQVKKIKKINKKTRATLDEVSSLSEKLSQLNEELSHANKELKDSNAIKVEYGALFMEYCSMAISALQQYQQTLKVAATQGNFENLIKKINSGTIENKTLTEFYSKFDEAVLNIYPQFIDKFNALLRPEEQIRLKPKEGLNTELRIYALIKIGIDDSEKIAKFLRCSLSTVYTYRSKIKKRALHPDDFEDEILKL